MTGHDIQVATAWEVGVSIKIEVDYEGGLRCQAKHLPSGATICTDAPKDNHGRGEAFSPTDLVAAAIGTCMLTLMGIAAERHQIDLRGTRVEVEKQMIADPVRRIARLVIAISIPNPVPGSMQGVLERAALTCPVMQSLDPRIEKPVTFHWS
jgi:putative redox protein